MKHPHEEANEMELARRAFTESEDEVERLRAENEIVDDDVSGDGCHREGEIVRNPYDLNEVAHEQRKSLIEKRQDNLERENAALWAEVERLKRQRDGWEADAKNYARSRECQRQMTERAEERLAKVVEVLQEIEDWLLAPAGSLPPSNERADHYLLRRIKSLLRPCGCQDHKHSCSHAALVAAKEEPRSLRQTIKEHGLKVEPNYEEVDRLTGKRLAPEPEEP